MPTHNEETIINDNLVVDGSEDETQVVVQGHGTQTNPLQQWEKSDGTPVAKLHDDARLQVGDESAMTTPETLIEAHRDDALSQDPPPDPQGPPQVAFADRGLHTSAHIEDEGGDANIEWSVHEVTVGDGTDLGKVTALRAGVTNQGNGAVDEAVGLEIADVTGATDNYAIKTGQGVAQFGDAVELGQIDTPNAPATGVRLYTKADQKLYMRPAGGSEQEVGSGASARVGDIGMTFNASLDSDRLWCDGTQYARVDYPELYALLDPQFQVDADNFVVPDMRQRVPVGTGIGFNLGATGGEASVVLTTDELPPHKHLRDDQAIQRHTLFYVLDGTHTSYWSPSTAAGPLGTTNGTEMTGSVGNGQAHNNMQPYIVCRYFIQAK